MQEKQQMQSARRRNTDTSHIPLQVRLMMGMSEEEKKELSRMEDDSGSDVEMRQALDDHKEASPSTSSDECEPRGIFILKDMLKKRRKQDKMMLLE